MPNLLKALKKHFGITKSIIPVFIVNKEIKIKGNTDGIRIFPQNIIESKTLVLIYSAFVKNKTYIKKIKNISTSLLIFKSYYYTPFFISISNRIYVLRGR